MDYTEQNRARLLIGLVTYATLVREDDYFLKGVGEGLSQRIKDLFRDAQKLSPPLLDEKCLARIPAFLALPDYPKRAAKREVREYYHNRAGSVLGANQPGQYRQVTTRGVETKFFQTIRKLAKPLYVLAISQRERARLPPFPKDGYINYYEYHDCALDLFKRANMEDALTRKHKLSHFAKRLPTTSDIYKHYLEELTHVISYIPRREKECVRVIPGPKGEAPPVRMCHMFSGWHPEYAAEMFSVCLSMPLLTAERASKTADHAIDAIQMLRKLHADDKVAIQESQDAMVERKAAGKALCKAKNALARADKRVRASKFLRFWTTTETHAVRFGFTSLGVDVNTAEHADEAEPGATNIEKGGKAFEKLCKQNKEKMKTKYTDKEEEEEEEAEEPPPKKEKKRKKRQKTPPKKQKKVKALPHTVIVPNDNDSGDQWEIDPDVLIKRYKEETAAEDAAEEVLWQSDYESSMEEGEEWSYDDE